MTELVGVEVPAAGRVVVVLPALLVVIDPAPLVPAAVVTAVVVVEVGVVGHQQRDLADHDRGPDGGAGQVGGGLRPHHAAAGAGHGGRQGEGEQDFLQHRDPA